MRFGVYDKQYDDRDRFDGAVPLFIKGDPDPREISTWRVERENGFLRQANRRFARKGNGFSKKLEFHERQIAIWMIYRNFCWEPFPRRPQDGSRSWTKRNTAAMQVGMESEVWTPHTLIEMADFFKATQPEISDECEDTASFYDAGTAPFWVNHSPNHRRAKVHKADCKSRDKWLLDPNPAKEGKWIGFESEEAAKEHAARLEPHQHAVCRRCLGSYNLLTTYGRRR